MNLARAIRLAFARLDLVRAETAERDRKLWHDCGFNAGSIMERWRFEAVERERDELSADLAELRKWRSNLRDRVGTRMNDLLCETKEGFDDSITGINEAWDVIRKMLTEDGL